MLATPVADFPAYKPDTALQRLLTHSAEPMMLFSHQGFICCNAAAIALIGCEDEAHFLTLKIDDISPEYQPDGQRSVDKASVLIAEAFQQGNQRFEWLCRRLNGEAVWVEVVLVSIGDAQQPILHATWRDIGLHKRTEIEKRQVEQHYQHIFESINDGLTLVRLSDGVAVTVNPAMSEMHGYQPAEFIKLRPNDYIHPDCLPQFTQFLEMARVGQRYTCEAIGICKDGSLINIEVTAVPLTYNDEPHGLAVIRDITERKAAEAALTESEAKFRRLVEDANDLIYTVDLDNKFTYLSPQFTQLWGYEVSEWLHRSITDIIHPQDLSKVLASNQKKTISGERRAGLELRTRKRDGSWLWVTCNDSPIRNADGKIVGIQGIARDITEQKRFQQEQARLTTILDATSDLVGIADMQGRQVYMNAAGYRLLEIPSGQNAIGQDISTRMPDWVKPIVLEQGIPAAIQHGVWQGEAAILTETGREIPVSQVIVAHKTEDGMPEYVSTIVRDISAQKQAEAVLQQKTRDLESALQQLQQTQLQMVQSEKMSSLGQLVAGVAHEINNPVGFIYGNIKHLITYSEDLLNLVALYQSHYPNPADVIQSEIEALELDFLTADMPKTLASIKIGAERIREIVKSLRTFSRLDEAACKAVDIHEGIDSSLVILEHRIRANTHHPEVNIIKQYGELPLVDCYAGQLNQVVMNILTNALDALEERDKTRPPDEIQQIPSTITIATEAPTPDCIVLTIADNGPGIPPNVQNRIFDPFFTTKPVGKGTGMGMSISYQIVTENHRGTLTCQSSPAGTTFTIEIPQRQALT